MSTFKKVISLVLCVAMLAGSFALVGDLAATVASAEELNIGSTRTVKTATATNDELIQTKVEGIPSYADLVAAYGTNVGADSLTDGFLYIGAEYYEADGKLTDYYVQPGDTLTARVYVKSNMYTADATIISLFNNSHWDVTMAGIGMTKDDLYTNGYTSGWTTAGNTAHPAWITNGYSNAVTSINITNAGWIKNTCGFDTDYLTKTDLVQVQSMVDSAVSSAPYKDTSDIWKLTYQVKVKEGLADGTEIKIESPDVIWASYIRPDTGKHDTRKRAYISNSHITATGVTSVGSCKTMAAQMDSGSLDYFILDLNKNFIIGEPEEAVKYAVNFYENDGTTAIGEAAEYEAGAAVTFPAAAENQIAWAIIQEGLATPGTLLEPVDGSYSYTTKAADVSFMRVLADDKFDVEISLGKDAAFDETVALPEGVTYNAEKNALVVALPVGGSFDLATIPTEALSKKDNTFAEWDVSGITGESTVEGTVITLGNVNGKGGSTVTAKVVATWETASYKVRYFLNKEAYDNGEAPVYEETVVAGTATKYNSAESLVDDLKFAGWYRADTNEVVNDKKVVIGKYTYSKDLDFYADWSEYANMATFMVRDYENGSGWKVAFVDKGDAESKTINKGTLNTSKDNAVNAMSAKFVQLTDMDPALIPEGDDFRTHIAVPVDGYGKFTSDLVYSGHKVYYILTTLDYSVTWKIPAYDAEAGAFTDATTDYTATVSTAYTLINNIDPYFATAKFSEKITNPTGWEITGWIDEATGEAVEFNENGAYVLKGLENRSVSLKAVYSLIEYPVAFNLKNSDAPDLVTMVGTVTLGSEITTEGKEFTINDTTVTLPVVDVASEDQTVTGYKLPAGYIFKGWTIDGSNVAEFPVTITEEIIKSRFVSGVIRFDAVWEAKEYSLKFYIINAEGAEELYSEHTVKVGNDIATYKEVSAEKSADINSKAPEGKSFSNIWINKETGASDSNTKMPAKDVVYVGSYVNSTVKVYIDLDTTGDINADIKEFKETALIFGQDITEVKEEMPYGHRSFATMVQRSIFASANETPSEIVGWNIYHVDSIADLYNEAKWEEGVNDEGTNYASSTLIFQPIWVAHKDMFFRAYDTDDNIYIAMGKNFKLYYWNSGAIVEKYSETQYNTNPELNVVLFHTIEIDWENLTMRFDAFPIPKSVFTLEGMLGIFEMLGNLLGSLL